MKKRYLLLAIILAVSLLPLYACASAAGSAQTVDRQLYETLFVAQAAIEQAKVEAAHAPQNVRDQVNAVISHYNDTYTAYVAFHAAVDAGTATDSTSVHDRVVTLIHEIADLRAALNHKEGPSS